jgi:hypothetical protein
LEPPPVSTGSIPSDPYDSSASIPRWDVRDADGFEGFFEFCFPRVLATETKRLGDGKRAEEGTQIVLEKCVELALRQGGQLSLADVLRRLWDGILPGESRGPIAPRTAARRRW